MNLGAALDAQRIQRETQIDKAHDLKGFERMSDVSVDSDGGCGIGRPDSRSWVEAHAWPRSRCRSRRSGRYLEPGSIALVSSALDGARNIMTVGWQTVMEFTPSLVGYVIAGNRSFDLIRKSRECVINLPTTALTDTVVEVGNTTGAEIDKFDLFGFTIQKADRVTGPLIVECHANFECRLADDALVDKCNLFDL
jgi:flavin reductase (DIM6/NTAB) family NADH-FMN oxidoreductase RutF